MDKNSLSVVEGISSGAFEWDKSENQVCLVPHGLECWRHFENSNLYLMSKRVESSSSSFSSLRGAISTRSAGVVMMSYLRVFLILRPDLWEEKSKFIRSNITWTAQKKSFYYVIIRYNYYEIKNMPSMQLKIYIFFISIASLQYILRASCLEVLASHWINWIR